MKKTLIVNKDILKYYFNEISGQLEVIKHIAIEREDFEYISKEDLIQSKIDLINEHIDLVLSKLEPLESRVEKY